ncbi:HIG1 domain family member 2A, mitochondrial-like [Stegodyphus dumicola]|uniref:HIG1 domain family member 2A, mitochondrial-like n=1 Tax=Stegodyphus dumicola TaxID=202533 RepID=UPI0015A8E7DB|nr:HIG1 domain family member 2A, mitochondrial-like [Stegodyphus dumicola]
MGDNNQDDSQLSEKEKLEWIETFEKINAIQRNGQGLREKMAAKIKQNPFVPVGLVATTLALSFGVYAMRTGNKRRSQMMMRTRIVAQGLTVGAILLGVVLAAKPT